MIKHILYIFSCFVMFVGEKMQQAMMRIFKGNCWENVVRLLQKKDPELRTSWCLCCSQISESAGVSVEPHFVASAAHSKMKLVALVAVLLMPGPTSAGEDRLLKGALCLGVMTLMCLCVQRRPLATWAYATSWMGFSFCSVPFSQFYTSDWK